MKTRIFTFILASLSMALTAQAGEHLIDAGGMYPDSGSAAHASSSRNDCASQRPLSTDDGGATENQGSSRTTAASTSGTRMRVSDAAGEESSSETASGGSAPGKSQAVPLKSRSTRWQSLVPGAIK